MENAETQETEWEQICSEELQAEACQEEFLAAEERECAEAVAGIFAQMATEIADAEQRTEAAEAATRIDEQRIERAQRRRRKMAKQILQAEEELAAALASSMKLSETKGLDQSELSREQKLFLAELQ